MILQVPQSDTNTIELMQTLLESLPSSHPKRKIIEADLCKLRSGHTGEKGVAYHLDFWYKKDESVIVANNLRLEFDGRTAQIDHLIAVPAGFLVLESKALPDRIFISDKGDWFRIRSQKGKQWHEGIYNPVEQNRRHIAVLEDIFRDMNVDPLPSFVSVIVLTRPEVVIEGYKPNNDYRLIRLDQLNSFIDRCKTMAPKGGARATELITKLIQYHVPVTIDVYARYGIDPKETMPTNERIKYEVNKKNYICTFCGADMVLQRNRNGLFWCCSAYPRCRNMVPSAVAVKVGNEALDRVDANKGFWSSLFYNRPKLCPVCGSVMVWKKGRKGEYLACPNALLCRYRG